MGVQRCVTEDGITRLENLRALFGHSFGALSKWFMITGTGDDAVVQVL